MNDRSVTVTGLDHIVLACRDVDATLAWYVGRLGLGGVRVDEWRRGEAPFPSARVDEATIIDFVPGPADAGGLDHICFVLDDADMGAIAGSGVFDVLEGPVPRFGARGMGTSIYVRDPDGTTVELRTYPRGDA